MDQIRIARSSRPWYRVLSYLSITLPLGLSTPAQATVELNIARVGYPTQMRGDVVRAGRWAPVIVDLALIDQQDFHGSLRVGQLDVDGDESFDQVQVHLRAETGGSQRYFLYTLANPVGNHSRFVVELFDEEGEVVQVLSQGELTDQASTSGEVGSILDDTHLILSLSTGTLGKVGDLESAESTSEYRSPVFVAHMSPLDLTEHWIGLEAVDFIVWDDARPEELTERQVRALMDWVRHGGTLLLAASRSSGSVKMTDAIYDLLPVDLGNLVSKDNLPSLRKDLLGSPKQETSRAQRVEESWWTEPFPRAVPVVQCSLRKGATSLARDENDATMARQRVGRGHLIFSGIMLKDFFSGKGEADGFFEKVFHLMRLSDQDARPNPISLFGQVVSAVGFATRGFSLLMLAGALSLAYVVVATLGTWQLLGRRGWRQHSWSAFGLVSVAASLLSVFSVGAIRGFGGETLHQISIVDAEAGASTAYATSFFGVKTSMDKTLDLWLPSDSVGATEPYATDCFLRPLPVSPNSLESSGGFADPGTYRLEPASALIHNARFRATLKRFEGRWKGMMDGSVTGEVRVPNDRRTLILEGSYLVNNLGVDLKGCYLLHAGLELEIADGPRSSFVYAYPLGELPADGRPFALAPHCNPPETEDGKPESRDQFRLREAQTEWEATFKSLFSGLTYGRSSEANVAVGQEKNALRLISTLGDYEPELQTNLRQFYEATTYSRDRLRHLDLRDQLTRECVILIGFADDPGPVRLFRRSGDRPFQMIAPDPQNSWTMYRIRIPVTLAGADDPQD